jgi:hypothetical protein
MVGAMDLHVVALVELYFERQMIRPHNHLERPMLNSYRLVGSC